MGWKKVIVKGWLENCKGGGFGGGRTSRRRTTNRVQGGDDGGRSQGGNRMIQGRSDEGRSQEGLGAGGARQDSGHSHNCGPWWSRRREDLWWSKGWRLQGANRWWRSRWWRSPSEDGEPMSQGNTEDPEGQGGADVPTEATEVEILKAADGGLRVSRGSDRRQWWRWWSSRDGRKIQEREDGWLIRIGRVFRNGVHRPHTPYRDFHYWEHGGQGNNVRGHFWACRQFLADREFRGDKRGHVCRYIPIPIHRTFLTRSRVAVGGASLLTSAVHCALHCG